MTNTPPHVSFPTTGVPGHRRPPTQQRPHHRLALPHPEFIAGTLAMADVKSPPF
jgi:hypothetical protein